MSDNYYEPDPTGYFAEGKDCNHIGNFDVTDHPDFNESNVSSLEFEGRCPECDEVLTFELIGDNTIQEPDF